MAPSQHIQLVYQRWFRDSWQRTSFVLVTLTTVPSESTRLLHNTDSTLTPEIQQGPNHVDGQINCLSAHLMYQSVDNEMSLPFLLIVGVSALAFAGGWIYLFCSIPLLENKLAFDADHGPPRNGGGANGAPSPYTNRAAMRR